MPAFALTIFAGAFLLFQVQPLIGKYILPWFGGSPGVWTTCMLFFQMLLLGGYAYAHTLSRRLRPRTQAVVHLVLLAAALATLPITPADHWKPDASGNPTWHILALLGVSLGLPYIVLSATGPLMQEWFRRLNPGASPYRLYALSNVGSLLALVSYPFYFETNFSRQAQATFWSWGLGVYAIGCAACAWRVWRLPATTESAPENTDTAATTRPTLGRRFLWICLPACASILLLAVTNKLCQDVAVIPFLWVLPLGLYLLTFIISFDSPRWYSRYYYTLVIVAALVAVTVALFQGADMPILWQVGIYAVTLFAGCMICHGELYRLKPDPRHLTSFYLMIAAGGAVGGLFVALVAPAIFDNYYETHLSVALIALLLLVISFRDPIDPGPRRARILFALLALAALYGLDRGFIAALTWLREGEGARFLSSLPNWNWVRVERFHWVIWVAAGLLWLAGYLRRRRRPATINWPRRTAGLLAVGCCALVVALGMQIRESMRGSLVSARNFYGVLSVFEYNEAAGPYSRYYLLQHGRITHGMQFAAPQRAREITSYFGPSTGLGLAFRHFPRQQNLRIGLIGLGVGTVTAYAKAGDYVRIYEIDPQVRDIAQSPFSYIKRCPAKVDIVMGDGRLSLENEPPQNFDFLIMDAFSSDAVPVHLLTREAFAIYQRHLKPDGVILVNISNRYLDLRPVVENAARAFSFPSYRIDSEDGGGSEDEGDSGWWLYAASWMVLSKNDEFMEKGALRWAAKPPPAAPVHIPLWTDDYTSMFKILL
jgi:hypothetical protein